MDKTMQWRMNEIMKRVTPLDLQPVLCLSCKNDSFTTISKMMYLPKLHPLNTLGQDITMEETFKICTNCGVKMGSKPLETVDTVEVEEANAEA